MCVLCQGRRELEHAHSHVVIKFSWSKFYLAQWVLYVTSWHSKIFSLNIQIKLPSGITPHAVTGIARERREVCACVLGGGGETSILSRLACDLLSLCSHEWVEFV